MLIAGNKSVDCIPDEWAHDSSLQDKKGRTVAMISALSGGL